MSAPPRRRVLIGDALVQLAGLPSASVDCVITSPPYFLLRDYGRPGQLGLEATVDEWVAGLVAVTDEIARVLRPTGTFWLNLGDSYSRHQRFGAPPKSLLLGPERLLLALAARGWTVRNKLVWQKSNPKPSSVADRLSCSWEPLYLLVRQRHYYFDLDAIRVPHVSAQRDRASGDRASGGAAAASRDGQRARRPASRRPDWAGPLAGDHGGLSRLKAAGRVGHPLGKNPGDVWRLPASGYRGAHFATFPESLLERPLLAGCPERTCCSCGQPWRRSRLRTVGQLAVRGKLAPVCSCPAGWQPGLVLDPFMGAGTVAVAAERLGRDWLGIELNPDFAALSARRLEQDRARPGWAA